LFFFGSINRYSRQIEQNMRQYHCGTCLGSRYLCVQKQNRMSMTKKYTILAAALLAASLSSCGTRQPSSGGDYIHTVMLVQPQTTAGTSLRSLSGVAEESGEASFGFKAAGQITKVYVEEGSHVSKGQLIAELDDKDYKLGVEAARLQYEQTERQVARLKKLYDSHSISGDDYDKATTGLAQLKVQLESNENQLSYCKLHSPVSGYVQSVNFAPGEMVNAGTPMVSVVGTGGVAVAADVSSEVYGRRAEITSVEGVLPGGEVVPMTVSSITPKADGNQLFRMRLSFAGKPKGQVVAGMNMEIRLSLGEGECEGEVAVPQRAVFEDGGESCVWVYGADSCVHRTPVQVAGFDDSGRIVVSEGLAGDERIVKAGVGYLVEGEKVKIAE